MEGVACADALAQLGSVESWPNEWNPVAHSAPVQSAAAPPVHAVQARTDADFAKSWHAAMVLV